MEYVLLSDSWVLEVKPTESSVRSALDANGEEEHPRFCWPAKPGEQYPYALRSGGERMGLWVDLGANDGHGAKSC